MLGQPALIETVEYVARQLIGVEHGAKRCLLKTPLMFPSGSLVTVKITNGGPGYSVTDMATGFEEARAARAVRTFNRHAPIVAAASGVGFDTRSFFLRDVSRDQLVGAVMAVANCSQSAATLVSYRQSVLDAHEAEDRLFARLERLFGKVEPRQHIVGISGTEWEIDAQVRIGDQIALFEAVSPVKQSIYATVAKYHDIARLPHPPVRIAAVRSREDLGSMLGVLSQAANVVEDATPDATVIQFARAA